MRNYFSGACGGMEEYTIVWKYVPEGLIEVIDVEELLKKPDFTFGKTRFLRGYFLRCAQLKI